MWYFDYQCKGKMGGIWDLFSGLADISQSDWSADGYMRCEYGNTVKIMNTALNGTLCRNATEDSEFNLRAYELACQKNEQTEQLERAKKFLSIVDVDSEDTEDLRVGYGEISSRKLKTEEFLFDEFENSETFESSLRELFNAKTTYLINYGVDIIKTLKNSLNGIPAAIRELASILSRDSWLKDIIENLCESAPEGVLLRRLELGC